MLSKVKVKSIQKGVSVENERFPVIFNALSDPGRFRIFKLLVKSKNICVTDIAHIFNISVPAASQQLRILEMTGLVRKERKGQTMCYWVRGNEKLVKSIIKIIS